MRATIQVRATFLTLLFVVGCGDLLSPTSPGRSLERNRRLWESRGAQNYEFTLKMDCFCVVNGPVRAVVLNDSVVRATLVSDGSQIDPRLIFSIPSIGKLFDSIEAGIINHSTFSVTYDPILGYPRKIIFAGVESDAGGTYTVSDVSAPSLMVSLRRLPPAEDLPRP